MISKDFTALSHSPNNVSTRNILVLEMPHLISNMVFSEAGKSCQNSGGVMFEIMKALLSSMVSDRPKGTISLKSIDRFNFFKPP